MTEEQKNYVLARGESYNKSVKEIGDRLLKNRAEIRQDYFESIRNLAIVAGAITTFAIMLLEKFTNELLIGSIIIMIIVVIISFCHLFNVLDRNAQSENTSKILFLGPLQQILKSCMDFLRGDKSYEDWASQEEEFITHKYTEIAEQLTKLGKDEDKINYTGDVILGFFVAANLLLVAGILIQYFEISF